MRVSSQQVFNIARNGMADVQRDLMKTNEQMTSGKRVMTAADDPVAATRILQLTDHLATVGQYLKNIDIAENHLAQEETAIDSVMSLVHRMQELAVKAGNTATLSPSEYQGMAGEVSAQIDALLSLMNTVNANGDYIFGGYKSGAAPFSGDTFSGFTYHGDAGQQHIKVSDSNTLAVTDSGKALFMDIPSQANTVDSRVSPANTSVPPARISVAQVVDQQAFDRFYPQDMVITFNADTDVSPPSKNFTVTERATGRVLVAQQPYVPGEEVVLQGVSFRLAGQPDSGTPAVPSTLNFGADLARSLPQDFTPPQSFTLSVGGRTERLVLSGLIADPDALLAQLNDSGNGNARRLENLGVTVDSQGFRMPRGADMTLAGGSPAIDAALGISASAGRQSVDGAQAQPGDRFFIESTGKQGLLDTLARFQDAMASYDGSAEGRERLTVVVAATVNNLSNSVTRVSEVQAQVGARMNTLEGQRDLHLDTQLQSRDLLKNLRDLDYAEASVRLAQQSLILQAAQQAFIRVSQLSLFNRM